jgi:predicted kinase
MADQPVAGSDPARRPALLIMRGLPGSGRTRHARAWVEADRTNRARVSRDGLRDMLDGPGVFIKDVTEPRIVAARNGAIAALLAAGVDVVCDDTNLDPVVVGHLGALAVNAGAEWEAIDLTGVPLEVCLARNAARTGPDRVPEERICEMHRRFIAPPLWVLATGSRNYPHMAAIRAAFDEIAAAHPGRRITLMHGQCDPQHPATGRFIRWALAGKLAPAAQEGLLGADWLADVAARERGWEIERVPAERDGGHRLAHKMAGFERNDDMIDRILKALDTVGQGPADAVCVAFISPCAKPSCRRRPHGSHGASHCALQAERAGFTVERPAAA